MEWNRGQIDSWWHQDHVSIPYLHEDFNNREDLDKWQHLGYMPQRFTGDMYDMRCAEPAWIFQFRKMLPMPKFSWSVYRMRPGDVLPEHSDTYDRFCRLYDIKNIAEIKRFVVFLEDWQSGHYFEIQGTPIVAWKAGTWISWQGSTPHLAANMGKTMRYTLQLTGHVESEPA